MKNKISDCCYYNTYYNNNIINTMTSEYFVFSLFQKCFLPRAILIPFDKADDEIKEMISKITKLGNKIESCYRKDGNYEYFSHYKINDQIINSKEITEVIGYWLGLLHAIDHDHEGNYPEDYLLYYINDNNQIYGPNELYEKLCNMTDFENIKIKIKECVMVSEIPFDFTKKVSLRFFLLEKGTFSVEEIEKILLSNPQFESVKCSEKNNMFAGYGYVYLKNRDDFSKLCNKIVIINNKKFKFD